MRRLSALTTLKGMAFLIALWAMAGSGFAIWWEHRSIQETALLELKTINRLLAAYVTAENRIAEVQLEQAVALVRRLRDPSANPGDPAVAAELSRIAAQQPQTESIWLYGRNKVAYHYTLGFRGPVDASDREFVRGAEKTDQVYLGAMFKGRVNGVMKRELTRRVTAEDGTLIGFAGVDIFTSSFSDYLSSLKPEGANARFGVVRTDGSIVLRYPVPTDDPPLGLTRDVVATFAGSEGVAMRVNPEDGIERLIAYLKLPDYPLYVISGVGTASLRRQFFASSTVQLAAGCFVGFGLIAAAAFDVGRRAQRSQRELAHALADKEAALSVRDEALRHKDLMFQEVHHRVKNNLQIVSSLLLMQGFKAGGNEEVTILVDSATRRINAIGMVHQQLYNQDNPTAVEFDAYIRTLASHMIQAGVAGSGVEIRVAVQPGVLSLDQAIPAALIVNEAVTNSVKHAFPEGRTGTVTISFRSDGAWVHLGISDDGVPAGDSPAGLGMQLMLSLADQLGGRLDISRTAGTSVEVCFPVEHPAVQVGGISPSDVAFNHSRPEPAEQPR